MTELRLLSIRRSQEAELTVQIDKASARFREVRKRLDAIQKRRKTIMSTIEPGYLPSLRLASFQASVDDESDIGEALSDLLPRLRDDLNGRGVSNVEIVLTYDGTKQEHSILVTEGTASRHRANARRAL